MSSLHSRQTIAFGDNLRDDSAYVRTLIITPPLVGARQLNVLLKTHITGLAFHLLRDYLPSAALRCAHADRSRIQ